jgi:hypothetical protein
MQYIAAALFKFCRYIPIHRNAAFRGILRTA